VLVFELVVVVQLVKALAQAKVVVLTGQPLTVPSTTFRLSVMGKHSDPTGEVLKISVGKDEHEHIDSGAVVIIIVLGVGDEIAKLVSVVSVVSAGDVLGGLEDRAAPVVLMLVDMAGLEVLVAGAGD
jgi:hypothetical protein